MPDHQIAHVNIAEALYALEDAGMADFMNELDRINALAENSDGFVWRLIGEGSNSTDIRIAGNPRLIVNMSVWASIEALFNFAYKTAHSKIMARRREWFEKPSQDYQVLWWVAKNHQPSVEEAMARLAHLCEHGPTAKAFTFKKRFPAPENLISE